MDVLQSVLAFAVVVYITFTLLPFFVHPPFSGTFVTIVHLQKRDRATAAMAAFCGTAWRNARCQTDAGGS
jgi:hypothetical protein